MCLLHPDEMALYEADHSLLEKNAETHNMKQI